jgi:hypothetical protein
MFLYSLKKGKVYEAGGAQICLIFRRRPSRPSIYLPSCPGIEEMMKPLEREKIQDVGNLYERVFSGVEIFCIPSAKLNVMVQAQSGLEGIRKPPAIFSS